MALTVGIDSFSTMLELDTYWSLHNGEAWQESDLTPKEKAAREATQWLVGTFEGLWIGDLPSVNQVLPWGRRNAIDREGRRIIGIPQKLKDAQAELASAALSGRLMSSVTEGRGGILSERIGDAAVQYDLSGPVHKQFAWARLLLQGLLKGGRGSRSLLRV